MNDMGIEDEIVEHIVERLFADLLCPDIDEAHAKHAKFWFTEAGNTLFHEHLSAINEYIQDYGWELVAATADSTSASSAAIYQDELQEAYEVGAFGSAEYDFTPLSSQNRKTA